MDDRQRLEAIVSVINKYLPPLGMHIMDAMSAIISLVDPLPAPQPVQEPETFERWNAKQHGDPEEIGFLQALRIAYCAGQNSVTTPPLPAQEPVACERCKQLEEQAYDLLGQLKVANLKWSVAHPWVGLTEEDFVLINQLCINPIQSAEFAACLLKKKNT